MNTYPLSEQEKLKELQTIKNILKNSQYHIHILKPHKKKKKTTELEPNKKNLINKDGPCLPM
jgi:hypothetical protein